MRISGRIRERLPVVLFSAPKRQSPSISLPSEIAPRRGVLAVAEAFLCKRKFYAVSSAKKKFSSTIHLRISGDTFASDFYHWPLNIAFRRCI